MTHKSDCFIHDEDRYIKYIHDVEIAKSAITDALLYPLDNILYDLYAVPSHNHQAYYALIYQTNGNYEMIYARTEINTFYLDVPIKMYPFSDAKTAETQTARNGRIIIGKKRINTDLITILDDIFTNVKERKNLEEDRIILDGVFQAMRMYKNNTVSKEIVYCFAESIPVREDKSYLVGVMNDFYLNIEKIISAEQLTI